MGKRQKQEKREVKKPIKKPIKKPTKKATKRQDSAIISFYTDAEGRIKKLEEERRRHGRKSAPWFNAIEFWEVDERKVAQILAFLLNPNESHEQGDRYLSHFIRKFGLESFTYNRGDKLYVKTNMPTNEERLIDIVVYKNSFEQAFAIVNETGLRKRELQDELEHYSNYLWNRTGDDYSLIYMSAKEQADAPKTLSKEETRELERSKKFKYLAYGEHLIDCFGEFAEMTESERVKLFLKDLEKIMRKKYMGERDMEAKDSMVDLINKSQKNLEISFLVSNSLPEVKRKLKERFNGQMESLRKELNLDAKQESDRVWLKPKGWKYHYFSYAYEDGHVFYGMTQDKKEVNKKKFDTVVSYLNEHGKGGFKYSEWWPAYKYMYRNIDNNPDFWKAIRNGKAKAEIKRFIELMIEKYETDLFYE